MILTDIKNKLLEVDSNVFYGMVDNEMQETVWNYIVFERKRIAINPNKTGFSYYFTVHIIRENFIPEGLDRTVIEKMQEISGMRLAGDYPTFEYVAKPNTNVVVEMLSIDFVRSVKV